MWDCVGMLDFMLPLLLNILPEILDVLFVFIVIKVMIMYLCHLHHIHYHLIIIIV